MYQTNTLELEPIHETVRDSYAARARSFLDEVIPLQASASSGACCDNEGAPTGCCSSSADTCCSTASELGYSAEELSALPDGIAETSLGCGDPVSIAQLQSGMIVLDLGSGGGFDSLLAARQVGETGRVIGVDMTPDMLSLAWRNAAKAGARNVEFRYGLIEKLPVESDSVDVILSNCVINLSPDKPAVFRESFRVLKPGGKFAVSDIVADRAIAPDAQANTQSYCSCVAGASEERWYLDQLREVGFREVRVVSRAPYASVPGSDAKTWSIRVEAWK